MYCNIANVAFDVFILCLMIRKSTQDGTGKYFYADKDFKEKLPISGVISRKDAKSTVDCALLCSLQDDCVSYFYEKKRQACHIYHNRMHLVIPTIKKRKTVYHEEKGLLGNIAVKKPTMQLSDKYVDKHKSHLAVDGRRMPKVLSADCAMLNSVSTWEVDLLMTYQIHRVAILARYLNSNVNNLTISVSQNSGTGLQQCTYFPGPSFSNEFHTFMCDSPLLGRFVRISTPVPLMTICEVEVYGNFA